MHTDPTILIQKEIAIVEAELANIAQPDPTRPGEWEAKREDLDTDKADELEVAEDLEELEGHESIVAKLQARLHDLRHALAKTQDGSYGKCEVCQKQIETGRMEANPAADTCVAHME